MFTGMNAIEFSKNFYDNDCCYQYLIEKKWGKAINAHVAGARNHSKERPVIIKDVRDVDMMKV